MHAVSDVAHADVWHKPLQRESRPQVVQYFDEQ